VWSWHKHWWGSRGQGGQKFVLLLLLLLRRLGSTGGRGIRLRARSRGVRAHRSTVTVFGWKITFWEHRFIRYLLTYRRSAYFRRSCLRMGCKNDDRRDRDFCFNFPPWNGNRRRCFSTKLLRPTEEVPWTAAEMVVMTLSLETTVLGENHATNIVGWWRTWVALGARSENVTVARHLAIG